MIKINIGDDYIKTSGHANYADLGDDIICSAVSTLIFSIIEYNEKLKDFQCDIDNKKNTIEIKLITNNIEGITLFNYLKSSLESLSMQYPKNIKVIR